MFTEAELLQHRAWRRKVGFLGLVVMLVFIGGGMAFGTFIFPQWDVGFFIGGFAGFLLTGFIVDRLNARNSRSCPSCRVVLLNRMQWVIETRACPECETRIVDSGRLRSSAVMKRRNQLRTKTFIANWFWLPIVLGFVSLVAYIASPNLFLGCEHCVVLFPAMALTAIWTLIRTRERRYLTPAVLSAILFPALILIYALT